jgi:hypothetical protein
MNPSEEISEAHGTAEDSPFFLVRKELFKADRVFGKGEIESIEGSEG